MHLSEKKVFRNILRVESIKKYFKSISKDGDVKNKIFWSMINKSHINGEEITRTYSEFHFTHSLEQIITRPTSNIFHNIWRHFDVLLNFPFTTS